MEINKILELKKICKKAVAILGHKESSILGFPILQVGGIPKNEIWIFTKNGCYKIELENEK